MTVNEPSREPLWNPWLLTPLIVAPLFLIGRNHGWVAQLPLWVLVGLLILTPFATTLAAAIWPSPKRGIHVWARVAVMQVGIAATIYATGWGATLALGLVFGAAE